MVIQVRLIASTLVGLAVGLRLIGAAIHLYRRRLKDQQRSAELLAAESKRGEAALREREQRLQLLFDYAPAALAMLDREMRYVSASHRWIIDYGLVICAL